jgi:hypothetical protein
MPTTNLGRVRPNHRGEWSGATPYIALDVVSRNGSSYWAIQDGTNQAPESSPLYWAIVVQKGDTGADGAAGPAGADGDDGLGVPSGGTAGQFLKKNSATDNDTLWQDFLIQKYSMSFKTGSIANDTAYTENLTIPAGTYIFQLFNNMGTGANCWLGVNGAYVASGANYVLCALNSCFFKILVFSAETVVTLWNVTGTSKTIAPNNSFCDLYRIK